MYSRIIDTMTLVHVQPHPNVLKAATITKTDDEMKGSLGIGIDAEISQKAVSEKTRVSENRYTYLTTTFFKRSF